MSEDVVIQKAFKDAILNKGKEMFYSFLKGLIVVLLVAIVGGYIDILLGFIGLLYAFVPSLPKSEREYYKALPKESKTAYKAAYRSKLRGISIGMYLLGILVGIVIAFSTGLLYFQLRLGGI